MSAERLASLLAFGLFRLGHLEVIEQPSLLALELLVLSKYGLHAAELCLGLGKPQNHVSQLR